MKQITLISALFFMGAVLLLPGCAPKKVSSSLSDLSAQRVTGPTDRATGESKSRSVPATRGEIKEENLTQGSGESGKRGPDASAAEGQKLPLDLQDIFFEFDSYAVRQEDGPVLKRLSEWLSKNRNSTLTIQGYCDERGTTDYNLALGQKRAEAAKAYLARLGVDEKRLKTLSYGKEAPFDSSHSEEAWKKNRRDHFIVQ
jgi:peptidoglycan-associated lipoprotein